jgi:hypothetical protein
MTRHDDDAAGGGRPMTDREDFEPATAAGGGPANPGSTVAVAAGDLPPRLGAIGDELERATRADLRNAWWRRRRVRRRIAAGAVALVILVPGVALATSLLSTGDVERSLPAGTRFLVGTTPHCQVVRDGIEYHCTIAGSFKPEIADLKGTVEPTVDASRHVNGGCRSLRSDGREWQCYIGKAAVDQQIISAGFLGEYAPNPGVG